MWIVQIALRRPYTFIVAALLIVLTMPFVLSKMATDIFPQINIPVVAELWEYKGLTAKEMSERVTSAAERELGQAVDNIEHTESFSAAGLGIVKVFFQPGTDINTALSQTTMSANGAARGMPQGTQAGRVRAWSASELPVVQLSISSDTLSDIEIGDAAGTVLRPIVSSKKGLSLTFPYGSRSRQVAVDLDAGALLANNLTPADIVAAMGVQNLILPTGTMKVGDSEFDVKLNGAIATIDEIGSIPIRTDKGRTLLLRDVANVHDGFTPGTTIARQNGSRSVLNSVLAFGGVSTIEAVEHIKNSIPEMLAKMPEGIDIKLMFDQSIFVKAAISNVVHEGLIAAALTATLILLFLGNWRSTLIIAVSIPLSIMVSLICLHLIGQTINLMTLGGLALAVGILVDDATVEIENIERQMAMGKDPLQAILDGAQEIAVPAFVSTLCICIVFLPMFFLSGIARYLFVPLAEAVIFAMIASYIISRTLVPTLVMFMMKNHHQTKPVAKNPLVIACINLHHRFNDRFEKFRHHFSLFLAVLLHKRKQFMAAFFGFCLLSLGIYPMLGQDLFPVVDSGQLRLHIRAPSGTRLEQMPQLVDEIHKQIRATVPAEQMGDILDIIGGPYSTINTLNGNSGTAESADSEIMFSFTPGKLNSADIMKSLRLSLPERFPHVEFFFQPSDQISQTLNFGIPAPIDVQFIGGKPADIIPLATALNNELRKIPGIVDAHVYQRWSKPTLSLEMNRTQLQQLGLNARNVAENMMIALSGSMQTTPTYWLNETNGNTYNIGARSLEIDMDSIDELMGIPIGKGSDGKQQLLGNVVTYKRTAQTSAVNRYNNVNMINIHANIQGRDLGSVSRDINKLIEQARSTLPRGVDLKVRGQIETLETAFVGLGLGIIVAIALVYLLVVVNFQSWLDPLIIISALPAALAGIAWMLFLSGTTLSVPALTGTIMTMGVATANSILLMSFARTRLQEGIPPLTAALEAASTRLRPVLMTAFAMIMGMLPMALGLGQGGEQNAPLGRAVIGGLLFATVSTLIFVPVVFASLHKRLADRPATKSFNSIYINSH
ncbi:efflux RND transporter permease subunit [Cellvibrio fibrivorans]|uniref:Multidrug efflux pump subunit AcrB n=1 Tax=Cellvibrio fibrivorans TaxID=126350 RepID=A0ABU1UXZ0_9GAMM|nr:efflux RND transporter permease subunit [Cellvibrio fibrivorans]MDR7090059.1 multidrug efflux pump subunit AcrB [Cellvibrio fibrivorans]